MLDIAIVGGGLCGLSLARRLHGVRHKVALFEARERFGGRIVTVRSPASGLALDLGPSWVWPATQPRLTALGAELGLALFPQHDEGATLVLDDQGKTPVRRDSDGVHGGAHRVAGGAGQFVEALVAALPAEMLFPGHVLTAISDGGDFVTLRFHVGEAAVEIAARQVVLALPPRLLAEHVAFAPALDAGTSEAMRDAGTWMATQAKIALAFPHAAWRANGCSGNAIVTHDQAVIGEVFDACDKSGAKAALGGFVALDPAQREAFRVGLPMLMDNQLTQLFGAALENGEQHYLDWAREPFTCSARDLEAPRTHDHGDVANPLLRRALWNGKLYLGGSETAAMGAGYLEGALDAAARIEAALAGPPATAEPDAALGAANAMSLSLFSAWVTAQGEPALDRYRARVNRALATQEREQVTQRALLGVLEDIYADALKVLDGLSFDMSGVGVDRGKCTLTPHVQAPFGPMMKTLVDDVVAYNRTSCALSNFPDEHKISRIYMQTIMRDLAAAWQEFSLGANRLLLDKAAAGEGTAPAAQTH